MPERYGRIDSVVAARNCKRELCASQNRSTHRNPCGLERDWRRRYSISRSTGMPPENRVHFTWSTAWRHVEAEARPIRGVNARPGANRQSWPSALLPTLPGGHRALPDERHSTNGIAAWPIAELNGLPMATAQLRQLTSRLDLIASRPLPPWQQQSASRRYRRL